ncbi:MAG: transposase [Phycisphaeraceae bacterium]|nr:transposase [Phycisphaeraceae bacterium]MCW5762491.1 transposase [Phycisphaeraceae bacterium]
MYESEPASFKRFRRIELPNRMRLCTFSTRHRLALFADPAVRDVFATTLERARRSGACLLVGWVVMPEHVHLLLMPPPLQASLVRGLWQIKRDSARTALALLRARADTVLPSITAASGRVQFWQPGGGHDRVMRSSDDVREKLRYIHENPVRRGLVDHQTDWAWSSARWYEGERSGPVGIDPIAL